MEFMLLFLEHHEASGVELASIRQDPYRLVQPMPAAEPNRQRVAARCGPRG
jgi:hypothetical protein